MDLCMHAHTRMWVCVHTHTLNILPSTIAPRIWFLVKFPSVTILIIHPGRIQLSYSTSLERRVCFWTQQMSCHTYIKNGWKIIANHLDQSQPVSHCDVTVMCIFWAYSQLSQCKSREISWGNLESASFKVWVQPPPKRSSPLQAVQVPCSKGQPWYFMLCYDGSPGRR